MELFSAADSLFNVHHSLDERPDPHDFSMHAHDRPELYYFIRGKGSYRVEGTEYSLHENDILLMREAETHKLVIDPAEPYERIAIHFRKELLLFADPEEQLLAPFYNRPLGEQNQYHMDTLPDRFWQECFFKLVAPTQDAGGFKTRLITYLLSILQEISGLYRSSIAGGEARETTAVQLVSYINLHLFEPLSLDLLSRQFYLSKSQLNRIFHQATGSTIARYIEIKRLLCARQKIRSGKPIGESCRQTGFNDYSNFYRAYKKQFACAPLQDKNTDQHHR